MRQYFYAQELRARPGFECSGDKEHYTFFLNAKLQFCSQLHAPPPSASFSSRYGSIMATRGDAAQAVQETARLGVSTVIEGISTGAIEVGAAAPVIAPVCVALLRVKHIVDKAKCNKEELKTLHARCELIVQMVIDKAKAPKTSKIDVSPLEEIVDQFKLVAERYATQSRFAKMLWQSRKNSDAIQMLRANIEAVVPIMALSVGVENAKRLDNIRVSFATLKFHRW